MTWLRTLIESFSSTPARRIAAAALAVALVQTAVLLTMVVERIVLLTRGREITLTIVPVDPRSIFRGDYVILTYDVSRIAAGLASPDVRAAGTGPVYVTLTEGADGWSPTAVSRSLPQGGLTPSQVVLKGRVTGAWPAAGASEPAAPPRSVGVTYGIESYFVPENTGRTLEKMVGEKRLAARIAVGRDGTAAIKGLVIDGKLQYEEPLL